jgi:hypothetical protein
VTVEKHGLRFQLDATVVGNDAGALRLRFRLVIENRRSEPIEISCQPLVFSGQRGEVKDGASWEGFGLFGEGGPLHVEWGQPRVEHVAPEANIVVLRLYPAPAEHDELHRGDALRISSSADSLCFQDATGSILTESVELATATVIIPHDPAARVQLVLEQ